ncbi:protein mbtH [Streptomyces fodineus]|uniref:Protein mbtH n=1 Tax=Streptomyces fodineus TaxID=1904616 RepID=A0A1D7YFE4_9ACTN|nr:MbtH family protein [Streptomyces fodineus]AOR34252.1 protein mbtH [Streptomyces fodineus]
MSTNPFEDADHAYLVLVNPEGQHSLWPSFAEVPAGWTVALGESGRDAALQFVDEHWTDLRPHGVGAATGS